MNRPAAIDFLIQHELPLLSSEERHSLLSEWWSIDADDLEYQALPDDLKTKLATLDEPDDPMAAVYEPLLLVARRRDFVGVVNSYLETQLARINCTEKVAGTIEPLAVCPCCQFRSLLENGGYEICRVCFWEDDGTQDLDQRSGPNHMTLREAMDNYRRFGAVSEAAIQHVLPDGKARYLPAENFES